MFRLLVVVGALTCTSAVAGPAIEHGKVVLQGLDKITARISLIELDVNQTLQFGTLRITARTCLETPPTEPPESVAFLEISAIDPGRVARTVYTGWMFASSPGLAALEHPVYDVWVLDCLDAFPSIPRDFDSNATAKE